MERTLDLAKAASPEVYGKQCASCQNDLDWCWFRRDSSSRDGRAGQCTDCEAQPSLSIAEHTHLQRERNHNSEAVRKQRWFDQEDLKNEASRLGRQMSHTDFLSVIRKLVPNLYVTEGRIINHLAVFQTAPGPQAAWEGRDFKYLFYMDTGKLPEFSIYDFDNVRDIIIREKIRGWRTVLLRLLKANLLDETTINRVFGRAEGKPANRYNRELQLFRNRI